MNTDNHMTIKKENKGIMEFYTVAPGVSISFNHIFSSTWPKGDDTFFSKQMLILNFCKKGRCDATLDNGQYAIVSEGDVCLSTVLPVNDFYYPGRIYEGVQLYIDCLTLNELGENNFLMQMGIDINQIIKRFCFENETYLHTMNESLNHLINYMISKEYDFSIENLRYFTIRLFYELLDMPTKSENKTYFTRSQIKIVKEAEEIIMNDLSKRITAKEMASRFGISESSFKLYIKGILGDSYLSYFRKKRMEKAADLLENTNLKIIEISNAIGYENQGKFAKVFFQIYGITPLEFRRLSQTKKNT